MTPSTSSITYRYGSPPLPFVILAASSITVKPDLTVTLWYEFGRNDPPITGTQIATLDPQQYATLIDAVTQAGLFTMPWPPAPLGPPVGGSQQSVTVTDTTGETMTLTSALDEEARGRFDTIVQALQAAVPPEVSAAMAQDQAAYLQRPRTP